MNAYANFDDGKLVDLLRSDDYAAFNEIYKRHGANLYLYAHKLLPDTCDAEDTVQEILSYIWTKRGELHITGSLASYLYTSVRHKALNLISRHKLMGRYLASLGDFMETGTCITDENIREKELLRIIDKTVAELPPKMRQIFELSRNEQLSQKLIAEKLNLSNKTVKKQVSNALKILRLKIHHMVLVFFV
jgi:RNA polymerase sigma-70 factor (ECF subfamily)